MSEKLRTPSNSDESVPAVSSNLTGQIEELLQPDRHHVARLGGSEERAGIRLIEDRAEEEKRNFPPTKGEVGGGEEKGLEKRRS
jgi:hypothetical protein